jgi:hypothetical protein
MFMSLVIRGLKSHAWSATLTLCTLTVGGLMAGLPMWLPGLAWAVLALGGVEACYVLEWAWLRVRGLRPATTEEQVIIGASWPVYVKEDDALQVTAGLRTLVVSRGALEVWEPHCLQALALQAEAAAEPGRILVRLGAAPVLGFGRAGAAVTRLGDLLAASTASALVVPLWVGGEGFLRVAGPVFGVMLVTILGCLMIASGLTAWGVGLLTGWALARAIEHLLACETARVDQAADRLIVELGYGPALLEALEMRRGLGEPIAPRISALRAALADLT